jgi:hypothetical protein
MAVIGFDDINESHFSIQPLTTTAPDVSRAELTRILKLIVAHHSRSGPGHPDVR